MAAKDKIGRVVSDKMQKTAVVALDRSQRHPRYEKLLKRERRFKADNTLGAKEGDTVRMVESRPLSKDKHWRITEVIKKV